MATDGSFGCRGPRSVEVSDTEALSYGEKKALAAGDPDFLEAAKLDDQMARLERLARVHGRDTVAAPAPRRRRRAESAATRPPDR